MLRCRCSVKTESIYVEKKAYTSKYTDERLVEINEKNRRSRVGALREHSEWIETLRTELPKFIPFLRDTCGLSFRGRILEIGAGDAWLSAEISKLPGVVEIIATDVSPRRLKEDAPRVFRLLGARADKITRMPADFHHLDFRDSYFDFVVCSAVLQDAANIVQVLREVKRVLKPGGRFVAIREPVWPLMKLKSRTRLVEALVTTGVNERYYSLAHYKEFFKQAAMPIEVKRVTLSSGLKYFFDQVFNGLTHARYAFIGVKRSRST